MKRLPFAKPLSSPKAPRAFNSTLPKASKPIARSMKKIRKVNPDAKARRTKAYKARLARKDWKALRMECFERDGFRCVADLFSWCVSPDCNGHRCPNEDESRTGSGLIADHLTYARFGKELLSDLRTLCRSCNARVTVAERANWVHPHRSMT